MPKFIVIDHSITDLGGHHYGYAAHVLRAAERAGYQPVLATNRKFTNNANAAWPILRVYEFDFWAELPAGRTRRFLRSIANRVLRTWADLRSRLLYKTRNATNNPPRRPPGESPSKLQTLHKLARLVADLHRRTLGHNRPAPPGRVTKAFGRDTKLLFEEVGLGPHDIVFIPTISHRDMLGLLEFFRAGSREADASWHLLFRRNLPEPSLPGDAAPDPALNEIRGAFESFRREAGSRRIYFHTDSEELTEQYEQAGTLHFRTLPIPHTNAPQQRVPAEGPLRVAYLGDARREKGYHLLPDLVWNLRKDYLETNKVRFVFQSNPNPREGEAETAIPRAEMDRFPSSMVALYKEPLSMDDYRRLLLSSGIMLLPYNRHDYRARSSGILAESLAAGIPVIVPAGTWLSRQLLLGENESYPETLRHQMTLLSSHQQSSICWTFPEDPAGKTAAVNDGSLEIGFEPVRGRVEIPSGATHLLVTLVFRGQRREGLLCLEEESDGNELTAKSGKRVPGKQVFPGKRVFLAKRVFLEGNKASGKCSVVVPLRPACRALRMGLRSDRADHRISIEDFQVDFLARRPGESVPLGAVGLAYHETQEIPDLIREIVDHYPHYRKTAIEFAGEWCKYHNSDRLVEELRCRSSGTRAG